MNLYQKLVDLIAPTRIGGAVFRRVATVIDRRLLKWSKGRFTSGLGTSYAKSMLLLTVVGRKTGKPRTVPLLYTPHEHKYIVVASKGGADEHPAWYLNVRESPDCEVEVDG